MTFLSLYHVTFIKMLLFFIAYYITSDSAGTPLKESFYICWSEHLLKLFHWEEPPGQDQNGCVVLDVCLGLTEGEWFELTRMMINSHHIQTNCRKQHFINTISKFTLLIDR